MSIRPFILVAVYYSFVFYYAIAGYKKPHGNMVRYLLLILALYLVTSVIVLDERWEISWVILAASNFAAVFIAYMACRLNKVKKNIFLAVLITALMLVKSFWPMAGANLDVYALFVLDRTIPLFMWATVALIYFFRFKEHKLAGITADAEEEADDE